MLVSTVFDMKREKLWAIGRKEMLGRYLYACEGGQSLPCWSQSLHHTSNVNDVRKAVEEDTFPISAQVESYDTVCSLPLHLPYV